MRRGTKPKPTHLKVLEGNPGKRPLNTREPRPDPVAPEPPETLTGRAREEWDRVAPVLDRLGLLTELDRAALVAYCRAWAQYELANEILDREGIVSTGAKGQPVKHPAVQIRRDSALEMARWAAGFGFTPSDRSRISLPDRSADDLEAILAGS